MERQKKKIGKRGAMSNFVTLATVFGVGIVSMVIIVILFQSLLSTASTTCITSTYVYNSTMGLCNDPANVSARSGLTTAGNMTEQALVFNKNFSSQWGLAGTILGYVLVLGILALIGVGGYMAYNKVRGNR